MTGIHGGDFYKSGEPIDEKPFRKVPGGRWHDNRACPEWPSKPGTYISSHRPVGGEKCRICKGLNKKGK